MPKRFFAEIEDGKIKAYFECVSVENPRFGNNIMLLSSLEYDILQISDGDLEKVKYAIKNLEKDISRMGNKTGNL